MPIIPPQTAKTINTASAVYAGTRTAWNVVKLLVGGNEALSRAKALANAETGGYRPSAWQDDPIHSMIDSEGVTYVFDAVPRAEHDSTRRTSDHPVQNGTNITDHSFQMPDRVSFEIGVSDIMDSYVPGQWQDTDSKSVSAFRKLKEIQLSGLPVTLVTRLNVYENMVIEHIHTGEDWMTRHSLKSIVYFRQIITASVSNMTVPVNNRPDTVANTPGPRQSTPPGSVVSQVLSSMGIE